MDRLQYTLGASVPLRAASTAWSRHFRPLSPTLPQPDYPGYNAIAAGAGEGIDPNFRPSMNQQYDFTVQRQINSRCQSKWVTSGGT